ncbi:2-hydroxy-3-oxopropionate reductase [Lecanosticta acicola]|uniref:3-hydroxyisobutyrate dehydrogenase n=1 Tax=Lecanosticta acicola TaxID=111012 RepID=A0AAI8YTR5_9PEZI|nr:2-hydroxy-3-oxopropionate reductase [Lecanosticta acicola]
MSSAHKDLKIGYIGLGNAGYPLASCIAKAGYPIIVQDADTTRSQRFVSEHPTISQTADSPEAWKKVDVLITMLPNGEIVRNVLLPIAPDLKQGCVVVDTSSSSPFHTRETEKLVREVNDGITLVDSPVTQEYAGAISTGEATFMVGCSDPVALEIVMPLLRCMGKHVFVMGKLGAGHAMKTLNNYVSGASIIGLCDALMAGQKFGLEPTKMVDVMNVGTGVNFSTKESFRQDGLTRRFRSGYQLALLIKDMKIAKSVLEEMGVPSALPQLMIELMEEALSVAGPNADHVQVIRRWEEQVGMQLRQSKL